MFLTLELPTIIPVIKVCLVYVYLREKRKKRKQKRGKKEFIKLIICIYVIEKNHNALRKHVMKIKIEIFIKPIEIGRFDWLVNLVLRISREKIKRFI